jgi:hypothetical protein
LVSVCLSWSTIPEISISIQICLSLWFRKHMTLDVCLSWLSYHDQYSWNS